MHGPVRRRRLEKQSGQGSGYRSQLLLLLDVSPKERRKGGLELARPGEPENKAFPVDKVVQIIVKKVVQSADSYIGTQAPILSCLYWTSCVCSHWCIAPSWRSYSAGMQRRPNRGRTEAKKSTCSCLKMFPWRARKQTWKESSAGSTRSSAICVVFRRSTFWVNIMRTLRQRVKGKGSGKSRGASSPANYLRQLKSRRTTAKTENPSRFRSMRLCCAMSEASLWASVPPCWTSPSTSAKKKKSGKPPLSSGPFSRPCRIYSCG